MSKLVCAGHASCDLPFYPVDHTVFEVDTMFVQPVQALSGGDALNASVNLTKLGMGTDVKLVAVVGEDTFGRVIQEYLESRNVNCDLVVKLEVHSIVTAILIDRQNERHFVFSGNAARNLTVEDVLARLDDDTEYLHIGSYMSLDKLEGEYMGQLFKEAQSRGIKTSFDVTADEEGKWLEKIKPGLPYTDTFFASYEEAVAISGGLTEPEEIAAFVKGQGCKNFVLKMGGKGCYATDFNQVVTMPTYLDLPVVDTTGAGDSFVGAYLFGQLHGFTMAECCLLGNVNGTLCVGSLGANTGTGSIAQIIEFIREHGAQTLDAQALMEKLEPFVV